MSDSQKEKFTDAYTARFQIQNPTYFDMIPAIIDHLTYVDSEVDEKTGKTTWYRKRLTPTDKELYRVLVQSAGNQNTCWKNGDVLAAQVGCGKNTITNSKIALNQSFEQLDGISLIDIYKTRTGTKDKETGKIINTKPKDIITVNYIWDYNNAWPEIREKEFQPMKQEISVQEAEIAIEKMRNPAMRETVDNYVADPQSGTCGGGHIPNQGQAPRGHIPNQGRKQITLITDPNVHETKSSVEAASLAFPSLDLLGSFSSECRAVKWLTQLGISKAMIKKLRIADELNVLMRTAEYLIQKWKSSYEDPKKPIITNLSGYYMKIYESGWYS